MKALWIDACPRANSRTRRIGNAFLSAWKARHPDAEIEKINLDALALVPLTGETLEMREALIDQGRLDHPIFAHAQAFSKADLIVICAPYWDYLFPASLKTYIEHVCVRTLTFIYQGIEPVGLCHARDLAFFTTSGSAIGRDNWGGEYLRAVTGKLLGIQNFHQISAEALDLPETNVVQALERAFRQAEALAETL